MADLIRKMQEGHTVEDIDTVIDEVYEARGEYDSLDERLDDMEGGAPTPSTSIPAMDGTGSAGTSDQYARADHVHPSDTSKQNALSAAQLAAANSGINSEKVAQYDSTTELETKDRAALVELVDSGAKNLLKLGFSKKIAINQTAEMTADGNGVVINGSRNLVTDTVLVYDIVTNLNNGLDTRYTLPAGEYIMTKTGDEDVRLQAYAHDGTNSIALGYTQVSDLHFEYTNEMKLQYPYLTFRIWVSRVSNFDNFTFYPMICTKAAWDISHAYQPYRPPYQELYEMVKALQANQ